MTQPCSLVRIEVTVSRVSGRRSSHGPVRSRSPHCIPSRCGQLSAHRDVDRVPTFRSCTARFWAIGGKFHCPSWRKGLGSAHMGPHRPDIFPRRSARVPTVPSPFTFTFICHPGKTHRTTGPVETHRGGRRLLSRPRADQCARPRDGRDHPSPLDARRSGAERCTVVLVALCLCAVARVHVAVATSTRLAVETITNVYTRSQYVIYWLSQLELPPLEITWARL